MLESHTLPGSSGQLLHRQTRNTRVLLGLRLLLGEHSDAEVSVLVWLKGRRDDQVLSWWQFETSADLPQVDERFGPRRLSVSQEEVLVQMHLTLALELQWEPGQDQVLDHFTCIRVYTT